MRLWKKWIVQQRTAVEQPKDNPTPATPSWSSTSLQQESERPTKRRRTTQPALAVAAFPTQSPPSRSSSIALGLSSSSTLAVPLPSLPLSPRGVHSPIYAHVQSHSDPPPLTSSPTASISRAPSLGPIVPTSPFRQLRAFSAQHFRMSLTLSAFLPLPLPVVGLGSTVELMDVEADEMGRAAVMDARWRTTWTSTHWAELTRQRPLFPTLTGEEEENQPGLCRSLRVDREE